MPVKKITISEYAGYTLYYYVSKTDGKCYYNCCDKHSPMMFATDNLTPPLLEFIRRAATSAFHARTWKYKTYKSMLESHRECFTQVSKHVQRDLQTKLDLP